MALIFPSLEFPTADQTVTLGNGRRDSTFTVLCKAAMFTRPSMAHKISSSPQPFCVSYKTWAFSSTCTCTYMYERRCIVNKTNPGALTVDPNYERNSICLPIFFWLRYCLSNILSKDQKTKGHLHFGPTEVVEETSFHKLTLLAC